MLCLEALTVGVFCSLDIVLFYIFFESLLIPMFLIIGIWGGKNRIFLHLSFFLYLSWVCFFSNCNNIYGIYIKHNINC